MRKLPISTVAGLLFLGSCTNMCGVSRSSMSPEQVVENYIELVMNMSDIEERAKLLEFTTGELHDAIAEVSDETIRKAYIERAYQLDRYSFVERRDRTPRETEITFQLSYLDMADAADAENAAKVSTENTVSVLKKDGKWFISSVLGNKTSIEFPDLKEMEIRAQAGN